MLGGPRPVQSLFEVETNPTLMKGSEGLTIPISIPGSSLSLLFLKFGPYKEGWDRHDYGVLDLVILIGPHRPDHLQFALIEAELTH